MNSALLAIDLKARKVRRSAFLQYEEGGMCYPARGAARRKGIRATYECIRKCRGWGYHDLAKKLVGSLQKFR